MKTCTKCNEEKPLKEFYKRKPAKDGLQSHCKACWKAYRGTRYQANKGRILAYDKALSQTPKGRYRAYKSGAKQRGISFNLSFDDFMLLWQAPCFYCGDQIATIGIDRIDSSVGYYCENVMSCCELCNKMKLTHSHEAFLKHIKQILNQQGEN